MTETALTTTNEGRASRGLQLNTYDDMFRFAQVLVKSGFAPKDCKTPENAMIAIQMGAELGLAPMQSIQNLAVINGRPSVWGDAMPALVLQTGLCADLKEEFVGTEGKDDFGCKCTIVRRGVASPFTHTFTVADAKKAKLWGKQGPWSDYPKRMLQMRARSWTCRDSFPDALKGLMAAEEAMDIPIEVQAEVVQHAPAQQHEAPDPEAAALEELRVEWRELRDKYRLSNQLLTNGCKVFQTTPQKATSDQMRQIIDSIRETCEKHSATQAQDADAEAPQDMPEHQEELPNE